MPWCPRRPAGRRASRRHRQPSRRPQASVPRHRRRLLSGPPPLSVHQRSASSRVTRTTASPTPRRRRFTSWQPEGSVREPSACSPVAQTAHECNLRRAQPHHILCAFSDSEHASVVLTTEDGKVLAARTTCPSILTYLTSSSLTLPPHSPPSS